MLGDAGQHIGKPGVQFTEAPGRANARVRLMADARYAARPAKDCGIGAPEENILIASGNADGAGLGCDTPKMSQKSLVALVEYSVAVAAVTVVPR